MFDFLKDVKEIKFHVLVAVLGFVLIIVSFFKIEDITKLQITPNASPIYATLSIGVLLILVSLVSYLLSEDSIELRWLNPNKIEKRDNGYIVHLGKATLNTIYGRIENCDLDDSSAIALPANEFFDNECVSDKKSSLGAFIHSKFPNQIKEIQELLCEKAKAFSSSSVEKETGIFQDSYGIGTSIFLDKPLSSKHKIIITAVTSQRAGKGLKSEILYIFQSVREIYKKLFGNSTS